jgi:thioredoxin reductase
MVAPQPSRPSDAEVLDAIVIGGGPAGLSAALVLGRCLRRVLVCDAGHPRNEPARIFNGFLSRDGSSPAEFLQICRDQLRRYETIEFRKVKVVDVERGDCRFTAILETGERVAGRMLLLATGLVDELPQIENFRQFYGSTVHNCPYCDGWECRDQPIAVTGGNQDSVDLAIELLLWSKDLVLCTNGPITCDRKTMETVGRLGIRVIGTPISRLEGKGDKLEGIRFTDGEFLSRSALFFSPGSINAHLSRNSSVVNFAREITVFSVGKTPRRIFLASMPREMPAVVCSLSLQQLPKAWRRPSLSIMPSSKQMLRVMRCAITSPAKLCLLIALRRGTGTVNLVSNFL